MDETIGLSRTLFARANEGDFFSHAGELGSYGNERNLRSPINSVKTRQRKQYLHIMNPITAFDDMRIQSPLPAALARFGRPTSAC